MIPVKHETVVIRKHYLLFILRRHSIELFAQEGIIDLVEQLAGSHEFCSARARINAMESFSEVDCGLELDPSRKRSDGLPRQLCPLSQYFGRLFKLARGELNVAEGYA